MKIYFSFVGTYKVKDDGYISGTFKRKVRAKNIQDLVITVQ
jgi:hypothetical protein